MHATLRERTILLLVFCAALFVASFASAAEILFTPATGSFGVGDEFAIKVTLSPGGESVNAADGSIKFDPALLTVKSISKDGSAFSLWTAEPAFSNSAGTINFSGGTPTAFSGNGTVITINFSAKAVGTAALSVTSGSVLAADGLGTDVYAKGADGSITVTEASASSSGSDEVAPEDAKPILPAITSLTHAKDDMWYATSTIDFAWKTSADVTEVRVGLSNDPEATPDTTLKADVTGHAYTDIADGVWYVFAQFKNEFGWGDIATKKIQIDTVPPDEFDFLLVEEEPPKFTFAATDATSGIDRYEIRFGETTVGTVKASDTGEASAPVPVQEGGPQKVTVRAIDKAGNIREVSKDLELPAVAKASAKKGGEEEEKESIITVERVLLLLFAMAIGGLVTWNVYTRKGIMQDKARYLHEVSLVRDKNDKIFSAMREEFEHMVDKLSPQPQLTPQERDFLEEIKEALDISEEVVDSSMEELKKTIRG